MRQHRIVLSVALCALLLLAPAAEAGQQTDPSGGGRVADRLETRRPVLRPPGFSPVETVRPLGGGGIGKPGKLAMADAWVTSDALPDDFSTSFFWFDDEFLSVLAFFFTSSDRGMIASIQVQTDTGFTVVSDAFAFVPEPDTIDGFIYDIGVLPAGLYKVTWKYKQGKKKVGQQFWIAVFTP